jgi:AraC family transcriptional regulator of adaptative response/methylated-DNA-[protein]-cysteine methyltransferase
MPSDYYRIEQAIRFIEQNHERQPELDELAAHLGLSPFHLQRLFRRWVGISPKRFLQFLTVEHCKELLAESRSVLDTTFAAGLSSPGRLHDLFVTIEGVTPGEYKAQGAGLDIAYGIHPSPFGDCLLAVTQRGICGLAFAVDGDITEAVDDLKSRWPGARIVERPRVTREYFERVFPKSGLNGDRRVTLFVKGTNFQLKVWEALVRIPPGHVTTYGDIAARIGAPSASRAVGAAVGANPISYIIPCHRVLGSLGVFGNYRWGPSRKKAILAWETGQRIATDHAAL